MNEKPVQYYVTFASAGGGHFRQDPNDEPASALLERIRFTRAAEAGKRPEKIKKLGGSVTRK